MKRSPSTHTRQLAPPHQFFTTSCASPRRGKSSFSNTWLKGPCPRSCVRPAQASARQATVEAGQARRCVQKGLQQPACAPAWLAVLQCVCVQPARAARLPACLHRRVLVRRQLMNAAAFTCSITTSCACCWEVEALLSSSGVWGEHTRSPALTCQLQDCEVLPVLWLKPAHLPPILSHTIPAADELGSPVGCGRNTGSRHSTSGAQAGARWRGARVC